MMTETDPIAPMIGEPSEDELLHRRGEAAEAFLRYCREGEQYFFRLLDEISMEIHREILGLSPSERERFSVLKAQYDMIQNILPLINSDIEIGKQAWNRLNGRSENDTGGIL